jgi:threonine dehydrogenase-like Zn-dependent dehydrogenase
MKAVVHRGPKNVAVEEGKILGRENMGIVEEVGPAAQAAQEQAEEFEQERSQVAPDQNPHDGTYVAGDAPSQSLRWAVETVAKAGSIGAIDPSTVITQVADMPSVLDAYENFDRRESGWTKAVVAP